MVSALLLATCVLATPKDGNTGENNLAAYRAVEARTGRGAEEQVKLALWCEAHGLSAERLKHLALAVLVEPSNATARGLMGLVAYQGRWKRPEAVAASVQADEALTARLAAYNARRARTPETADAQWKLALWCESQGLDAEAQAHFAAVTRLDPGRAAAWKKLGCKKVGGRWLTDAQIAAAKAEAEAQSQADRKWKPLLTKWRGWLTEKARRAEAESSLAEVRDPRAVPAVWSVLVASGPAHHARAVQLLGQIDAAASSRALAFLSVFDDAAEVRRAAAETLRRRDPREFAGLLVGLLRDPIKYEVRPVGGPGSPGALFVAGQKVNLQRVYLAPVVPYIPPSPNDQIVPDIDGLPVIVRSRAFSKIRSLSSSNGLDLSLAEFQQFNPTDPGLAQAVSDFRANASQNWQNFFASHSTNRYRLAVDPRAELTDLSVTVSRNTTESTPMATTITIPVGRMIREYQKSALSSQMQLDRDIAALDALNDSIEKMNGRVARILADISGQSGKEDRATWRRWWVNVQGYTIIPTPEMPRPTIVQGVMPSYIPQSVPVIGTTAQTGPTSETSQWVVNASSKLGSCFGAGTLVRTLDGTRPIEEIQVGDQVLTQNIQTGALGYQPVTVVHHNPPSPTFLVKVRGDTVVSSPFHRFWVVGRGWVMARDLKGDETLRLLEGPARVESVTEGAVQPVYNLDIAHDHDFFAGAVAALVHDNTLPDTRLTPFDAAAAPAPGEFASAGD